jgi:hypothetical protein
VPIKKETVAEVVAEASQKMNDPNYSAVLVGGFVQLQTPIVQFVSAHDQELGGAEAIVNLIFHAALIGTAFARGLGRTTRMISFEDLDDVAGANPLARLEKTQPFIHGFIEENLENPEARKLLALIALAMDR